MAELKNMTVQALRDLARKALGRGHSRLKTKSDLVAALQAAGKNVSGAAARAVTGVKEATGRAAKAAEKVVETATRGRAAAKAQRAGKVAAKKQAAAAKREAAQESAAEKKAAAAAKKAGARRPSGAARKEAAAAKEPAARKGARAGPPPAEPQRDEPDADGYFVARVRGEEAVRDAPHPMTESALEEGRAAPGEARRAAPRHDRARERVREEDLGELPWTYDDDALVALPRDPRTLFVYWDHQGETLENGFAGLDGGKAQLWIFARNDAGGWDRVRVLDFALESRSYYVHDLDPGRVYRAEIHVVDRGGRQRRLQDPSNEMTLPPFGPSTLVADRFMRLPWSEPLSRLLRHVREGAPFPEELRALLANLSDWSRFVGPTWGAGGTSGAGGPGGRPGGAGGPSGGPSSPSSPWQPFGGGSGEGR
jgi:hypothetical protein